MIGAGIATALGCATRAFGPALQVASPCWTAVILPLAAALTVGLTGARAPRVVYGVAIGSAMALLPLTLSAANEAAMAVTSIPTRFVEPSARPLSPEVFAPWIVLGLVTVPFSVAAYRVTRSWPRAWLGAGAAMTLGAAVIAVGGLAALRRPAPDDVARVLDRHVVLEAGGRATVGRAHFDYAAVPDEPLSTCRLRSPRTEDTLVETLGGACPPLVVRSAGAYAVVFRRDALDPAAPIAIFEDGMRVASVDVRMLARVGPPRAWAACAALGWLGALAALAAAARDARRARRLDRAVDAVHEGAGWVLVEGVRRHVGGLETAPAGPVAIELAESRAGPTYRTDGLPEGTLVGRGTRQLQRWDLVDRLAARVTVAVTVALLTTLPLLVAQLDGL